MSKLPSISYIIGTHNEKGSYIDNLLNQLYKYVTPEDEIIVVDDHSANLDTLNTLQVHNSIGKIQLHLHALDGDFAAHRNYTLTLAKKDWVFEIDVDEIPHDFLLQSIKEIILSNPTVEAYRVPRINIVPDITDEDMARYGWRFYPGTKYINMPDYQMRIHKNSENIKWTGRVHEQLIGHSTHSDLPYLDEEGKVIPEYSLLHVKSRERQVSQNSEYEKLMQK